MKSSLGLLPVGLLGLALTHTGCKSSTGTSSVEATQVSKATIQNKTVAELKTATTVMCISKQNNYQLFLSPPGTAEWSMRSISTGYGNPETSYQVKAIEKQREAVVIKMNNDNQKQGRLVIDLSHTIIDPANRIAAFSDYKMNSDSYNADFNFTEQNNTQVPLLQPNYSCRFRFE